MEDTKTKVTWPSKLKVGAKSKKDPHIKIIGDPENVHMAKEKVLEILDTKRNKVTLKMDVSFTDHSHIIGKGGRSIQQVMEDTGCHIHFPDSNRNSMGEKSNQVSIAGLPAGVEKARCQIRELLPVVLTFDIPQNNGFLQPVGDISSDIQMIQQKHGFTVSFRPKLRAITVIVRGSRKQLLQQKQGMRLLMNYLTGGSGAMLPVSLSLEVMPQHHTFVMGKGNCNISSITRDTGATVTFPDPTHVPNYVSPNGFHVAAVQQPGIAPSKSTVVISGHIDSVCAAWQQLMSFLPLVLMFDLKEGQELDSAQVTRLMNQSDVNIVIRPKPKQHTKCLLVRGAEKDSRLLFEIRRQLLGAEPSNENLPVCCEKHSKNLSHELSLPKLLSPTSNSNGTHYHNQVNSNFTNGFHPYQHQQVNSQILQTPLPLQVNGISGDLSSLGGGQGNYPLLPWLLHQLSGGQENPLHSALTQAIITDLAVASLLNSPHKDFIAGPPFSDQASSSSQPSSLSSPNDSPCVSPVFMTKMQGNTGLPSSECLDSIPVTKDSFPSIKSWRFGSDGSTKISSEVYSGFSDCPLLTSSSSEHLQVLPKALPAQSVQPHARVLKPMQQNTLFPARKVPSQGRPLVAASVNCIAKQDVPVGAANHGVTNGAGSIGCERRSRDVSAALADYNAKKLQAVQAVQKKVISGARIPTDVWSGYGFSKTLPEDLLRNRLQESRVLSNKRVDPIPESPVGAWRDDWYGQASSIQEHFTDKKNGFVSSVDSAIPSFSSSNYFDSNLLPKDLTKDIKDLRHLLSLLGLEKYMEVFQQQQVDLSTFLTLTDGDLQELSIHSFGRRKMLKAISELKQPGFQPAPGAERRALFSRQQSCCASGLGPDW